MRSIKFYVFDENKNNDRFQEDILNIAKEVGLETYLFDSLQAAEKAVSQRD